MGVISALIRKHLFFPLVAQCTIHVIKYKNVQVDIPFLMLFLIYIFKAFVDLFEAFFLCLKYTNKKTNIFKQ